MKVLSIVPYNNENSFPFAHRQIDALKNAGITVETYHLKNRLNPIQLGKDFIGFQKIKKQFRPNVIHAHYGSMTALFAAMNLFDPLVITFRGSDINDNPSISKMRMFFLQLLSHMASFKAKHVFCVSEEIAGKLRCNPRKVSILPSGINLNEFSLKPKAEMRRILNLPTASKIILFNAGRNPRLKRLDLAQRVHSQLLNEISGLELLILEGNVSRENIPTYLNAADLLLLTSETEGSPNIIKEAAAVGLPVVSFNVGDVKDIIGPSNPQNVIENRSLEDMVSRSRSILLQQSSLRDCYLPSKYRAEVITSQIISVYQNIARH